MCNSIDRRTLRAASSFQSHTHNTTIRSGIFEIGVHLFHAFSSSCDSNSFAYRGQKGYLKSKQIMEKGEHIIRIDLLNLIRRSECANALQINSWYTLFSIIGSAAEMRTAPFSRIIIINNKTRSAVRHFHGRVATVIYFPKRYFRH